MTSNEASFNVGSRPVGRPKGSKSTYTVTPLALEARRRAIGTRRWSTGLYSSATENQEIFHEHVKRVVKAALARMPWLTEADLPTLRSWAATVLVEEACQRHLAEVGVTTQSGTPRRLLSEWRSLVQTKLRLEQALGMVASSRAQLGATLVGGAEKLTSLDTQTAQALARALLSEEKK